MDVIALHPWPTMNKTPKGSGGTSGTSDAAAQASRSARASKSKSAQRAVEISFPSPGATQRRASSAHVSAPCDTQGDRSKREARDTRSGRAAVSATAPATSAYSMATATSSSTASSWSRCLDGRSNGTSRFTTRTASRTTIARRTSSFGIAATRMGCARPIFRTARRVRVLATSAKIDVT
jgi:hypothetical protein